MTLCTFVGRDLDYCTTIVKTESEISVVKVNKFSTRLVRAGPTLYVSKLTATEKLEHLQIRKVGK